MSQTNRPIAPSTAAVQSWLADTQSALLRRRDEILAGAARFAQAYPDGIPNEEVQGRAADFASARGIMGVFLKEADSQRTGEKAPYLAIGRVIDSFFKDKLTAPVEKVQHQIRGQMAIYASKLEAERREQARLEAERAAAEAAAAAEQAELTRDERDVQDAQDAAAMAAEAEALAEAKAAELSRTRGDLGTVVSLRVRQVVDYDASNLMALVKAVAEGRAPLDYLQFNTTRINFAVRSEKKTNIPGVVIREERTVV